MRNVADDAGGQCLEADQVGGVVLSGGGDWAILGADGFGRMDVQLRLEDGAAVYMTYQGLVELNDKVQAGLAGTPSRYEDHHTLEPRARPWTA